MMFFEELTEVTAAERAAFVAIPVIQAALAGRVELATYVAFLREAYYHVRHTVPLLMACGARLPERLEWLRSALGTYVEEEKGHHEWILQDIAACGGDADAVRTGVPSVATEVMVAYAYDTIARDNPVGFFGMVHVLEGMSTRLASQAAQGVQEALRLPAAAFTYLSSHGAIDVGHVALFEGLMNRLTEGDDRAAVIHRTRVFYRLYGDVFRCLPVGVEVYQ
jgi:pyrroloquinoline quinone (PQQ) biosynthesis protein C